MALPTDEIVTDLLDSVSVDSRFDSPLSELQSGRLPKDSQGCILSENLTTPNEADTLVVGTMFTVQTHEDPISMQTMEIIANPIESLMNVQIYSKGGGFKGAENDPSKWIKIADTSIVPAREGRGTLIPSDDFTSFTMNPNELRSFFVSLHTSDLRYRRADDFETGQTFVSDGFLSMNVGVGLVDPGFGNRIVPSRMFSGILHYTRLVNCDAPNSKTLVTYTFHVKPEAKVASKSLIAEELSTLVGDAVRDILNSDLSDLSGDHTIGVDSIVTSVLVFEQGKCPVKKWRSCLSIDSKITISHRNTITGGELQFLLLQQAPEVTKRAQQGNYRAVYAGHQPLLTSIFVAFKGVPAESMDNDQQRFLEQVTTDYLDEQIVGMTNVNVIGTKVTSQRLPDFSQRRLRSLQGEGTVDSWIELSVDVLAILIPPYAGKADFVNIVDDAFRYDRQGYIEDLRTGRHRPGSMLQGERGDFFLGISNVNTRIPGGAYSASSGTSYADVANTASQDVTIMGMSKTNFILICVGSIVAVLSWKWYESVRRSSREDAYTNGKAIPLINSKKQPSRRSIIFPVLSKRQPSKSKSVTFGEDLPSTELFDAALKDRIVVTKSQ